MEMKLSPCHSLKGDLEVSADKSISHRALIFSALAQGEGSVHNCLEAQDTRSTCNCLRQLGVDIKAEQGRLVVRGNGWQGLQEPEKVLDCGNSGTTMRLLTGLLAGRPFLSILSGDDSLRRRPMRRIIEPLERMGAKISARHNGLAPLAVNGAPLRGIQYQLPVSSAQLKTALLLAGLQAQGPTLLLEPEPSRDHSERMLAVMGADLQAESGKITLKPGRTLQPQEFKVPGDISSAAFFIVAASIVPGSELLIRNVGVNPTRCGVIEVLKSMGADITLENRRVIGGEPVADLLVRSAPLQAAVVEGALVPRLVDEIPVLAVAMAVAEGESRVEGAAELRVKESDRLAVICSELNKMGACIEEMPQGLIIKGRPGGLKGNRVASYGDHRIAMSLAIAALVAKGDTSISQAEAVDISFPQFWTLLSNLTDGCERA